MCLISGQVLQAGNLHNGADSLQQRVLVARAAWLVGVCGGELPPPLWGEALVHLIRHMGSPDLVLALFSVSAVLSLLSVFIEQQHVSFLPPAMSTSSAAVSRQYTCQSCRPACMPKVSWKRVCMYLAERLHACVFLVPCPCRYQTTHYLRTYWYREVSELHPSWHQRRDQKVVLCMQAIKEAGESKDELHARMLLYMSPSAARAQDPSFIQVCFGQRCSTPHCTSWRASLHRSIYWRLQEPALQAGQHLPMSTCAIRKLRGAPQA